MKGSIKKFLKRLKFQSVNYNLIYNVTENSGPSNLLVARTYSIDALGIFCFFNKI